MAKWYLFINKQAKQYVKYYPSKKNFEDFDVSLESYSAYIIGWMEFWPISLTWTLIDDPIRTFFELVFEKAKGLFQNIAKSAYDQAIRQNNFKNNQK